MRLLTTARTTNCEVCSSSPDLAKLTKIFQQPIAFRSRSKLGGLIMYYNNTVGTIHIEAPVGCAPHVLFREIGSITFVGDC